MEGLGGKGAGGERGDWVEKRGGEEEGDHGMGIEI